MGLPADHPVSTGAELARLHLLRAAECQAALEAAVKRGVRGSALEGLARAVRRNRNKAETYFHAASACLGPA